MSAERMNSSVRAFPIQQPNTPLVPLLVLHVNDNTDDQVLFQAACREANVPFQWHVAESAERGISYLESLVGMSRSRPVHWPDLVVLDVVMPGASGLRVLQHIRATPELSCLPVVILTGHPSPGLREEAHRFGADSFFEKSVNFADTVELVRTLYSSWSGRQHQ
jgi:CheY-like chemotaxis protein